MGERAVDDGQVARAIERAVARHSFCVLATAARDGAPHVTGILYQGVGPHLLLATGLESRKARNVQQNPRAAVCIPVRRFPFVPPFCVQFRAQVEVVRRDDPEIVRLLEAGALKRIVAKGVLDEPDLCFLRVTPARRIATFGVGVGLRDLLRDPLHASRSAAREAWDFGGHAR